MRPRATTASWYAPSRSCTSLRPIDELFHRLSDGGRDQLRRVAGALGLDPHVVQCLVGGAVAERAHRPSAGAGRHPGPSGRARRRHRRRPAVAPPRPATRADAGSARSGAPRGARCARPAGPRAGGSAGRRPARRRDRGWRSPRPAIGEGRRGRARSRAHRPATPARRGAARPGPDRAWARPRAAPRGGAGPRRASGEDPRDPRRVACPDRGRRRAAARTRSSPAGAPRPRRPRNPAGRRRRPDVERAQQLRRPSRRLRPPPSARARCEQIGLVAAHELDLDLPELPHRSATVQDLHRVEHDLGHGPAGIPDEHTLPVRPHGGHAQRSAPWVQAVTRSTSGPGGTACRPRPLGRVQPGTSSSSRALPCGSLSCHGGGHPRRDAAASRRRWRAGDPPCPCTRWSDGAARGPRRRRSRSGSPGRRPASTRAPR